MFLAGIQQDRCLLLKASALLTCSVYQTFPLSTMECPRSNPVKNIVSQTFRTSFEEYISKCHRRWQAVWGPLVSRGWRCCWRRSAHPTAADVGLSKGRTSSQWCDWCGRNRLPRLPPRPLRKQLWSVQHSASDGRRDVVILASAWRSWQQLRVWVG